jgi:hypothetical protein
MGPESPTLHYVDDPWHRHKPRLWHPTYGWGCVVNVWVEGYEVSFRELWEQDPTPGGSHLVRFRWDESLPETCTWENLVELFQWYRRVTGEDPTWSD